MTVLPSREDLTSRIVPSMAFSDGSPSSMTPAPASTFEGDPAVGAEKRFSVRGNAIVTGGAGTLGLQGCNALLEHGLQGLMIFDINLQIPRRRSLNCELNSLKPKSNTKKSTLRTKKLSVPR
ncbi:oxidoreductase short chain dehydrogenase/reductase family [Penicillium manginii]|uniref:oxidoreductase short chain dehydrogenase/reductase family n=1 Tax=Penicillium manginii TaxID=203109 RepID=UPI0025493410|nr:oxidoreductase short chain dehydrogenase/reductase family [Penicillium manginii]KAJ5734516.1 oxidoreductase short chain dehydrogenase/reductase family [Penicillium manginii]